MEFIILAAAFLAIIDNDPAPGIFLSQDQAARYTCERTSIAAAASARPGVVRPEGSRGEMAERIPVVCTEQLMRPGLRSPRDEAILRTLNDRAGEAVASAWGAHPELHGKTWLVEAFYPSSFVSAKLDFAVKTSLMDQGATVSDRPVTLAAGDVRVLTQMSPFDAYPAACTRYAATDSLGPNDVLLAVVTVDPLETELHVGVCTDETWAWIR